MNHSDYRLTPDYRSNLKACIAEGITGKRRDREMLRAYQDYCIVYGYEPIYD